MSNTLISDKALLITQKPNADENLQEQGTLRTDRDVGSENNLEIVKSLEYLSKSFEQINPIAEHGAYERLVLRVFSKEAYRK